MAADPVPRDPAGIDVEAVTRWLCGNVRGVEPPLRFELVAGGRSNLTFRVEDAAGRLLALRRPPVSHVLPTAHDMAREHRILEALHPTPVPVPEPFALCEDRTVTGEPFYVMAFVEGLVLRDADTAEQLLPGAAPRWTAGMALADTLAALHALDVDAVGLGGLARRDGYLARQIRRWSAQVAQSSQPSHSAADGGTAPAGLDALGRDLEARIPPEGPPALVHGDFRLDNALVHPDGTLAAVLDWELATIGDPMADVGTFLDYWGLPDDGEPILGKVPATALRGFPTRAEVLDRYAAASGRDVSGVAFYQAFGYWRLACILYGVYSRYRVGASGGDPESVDALPGTVARLAELGATTLGSR